MKDEIYINCGDLNEFEWYTTQDKACCYKDASKEREEFTALILGASPDRKPHRQFQSIQLYRTHSYYKNLELDFEVFIADFDFKEPGQWLTIAEISSEQTEFARADVAVTLFKDLDGYRLHLQNVPWIFQEGYTFRDIGALFPLDQWVRVTLKCDMLYRNRVQLWQDDILIAEAKINHTQDRIAQAHLGLTASPYFSSGLLRNRNVSFGNWK